MEYFKTQFYKISPNILVLNGFNVNWENWGGEGPVKWKSAHAPIEDLRHWREKYQRMPGDRTQSRVGRGNGRRCPVLPSVLGSVSGGHSLPAGIPVHLSPMADAGAVAQNLSGLSPWQDACLLCSLGFGGRQPTLLLRHNWPGLYQECQWFSDMIYLVSPYLGKTGIIDVIALTVYFKWFPLYRWRAEASRFQITRPNLYHK